jgi:beta-phosphoglucomutase-like phosphatase (HAD superfamily)
MVIEDSLAGVEAGRRGGFALVVGVGRGEKADALRLDGAHLVADVGELRAVVSR